MFISTKNYLKKLLSAQAKSMEQHLRANQSSWSSCICLKTFTGADQRSYYSFPCLSSDEHKENSICKECANQCYKTACKVCSGGEGQSFFVVHFAAGTLCGV